MNWTQAYLKLHIAVFLFGVSGVLGKLLSTSPLLTVAGRTFFGAMCLLLLLLSQGVGLRVPRKLGVQMALLGVLLFAHWYSFFLSIELSTVAIGVLTFSTFPLFTVFLEALAARRPVHFRDLAVAVLVVAALGIAVTDNTNGSNILLGVGAGVFSGFSFALLQVGNLRIGQQNSPLTVSLYQNLTAFGCSLFFIELQEVKQISLSDWLLLIVLGVFCTGIAHTLYIASLRFVSARIASLVAVLEPIYGILLAAVLVEEVPSQKTLAGATILLIAMGVESHQESRQKANAPE